MDENALPAIVLAEVMTEGAFVHVERDVIVAGGADAGTFLQGQLSQDIDAIEVGGSAPSFLLQPQGKVDALIRVSRRGDDDYLIDVDAGFGDGVLQRLRRFLLRVDCTLEPVDMTCVAVRGPAAAGLAAPAGGVVAEADWSGLVGVDLLGPAVEPPAGVAAMTPQMLEELRIRSGWPAMGRELTEKTMPAETGLVDRAVSFTKGCYVGQELVARIDSRGGNVPRRLCGLIVEGGEVPSEGAMVLAGTDDAEVGRVTSGAAAAGGGAVALAFVHRSVDVPAPATIRSDSVEVAARIADLPLLASTANTD